MAKCGWTLAGEDRGGEAGIIEFDREIVAAFLGGLLPAGDSADPSSSLSSGSAGHAEQHWSGTLSIDGADFVLSMGEIVVV